MPRDLRRRRSSIENDCLPGLHQLCSGLSNSDLFVAVQRFLSAQGIVLRSLQPPDGPPVRADYGSQGSEGIQVTANGNCGNRKALDQIGDGDVALLINEI